MPHGGFFNDGWRKELERMIDDWPSIFNAGFRAVRIDVYETPEEVIVTAELPGLERKEDVQIDVEGTQLTISGQIRRGQEIKREQFYRQERYIGQFRRTITLPATVKEDEIKATYRNGILEIRMPKENPGRRRTIDIEFE
ncbi:MAG TPA: Hsp20/alpha crystallin family protein [Clostridia bacterium]|nr:Hsp20/alpha crystallin family protein [Clostridia bacterium]